MEGTVRNELAVVLAESVVEEVYYYAIVDVDTRQKLELAADFAIAEVKTAEKAVCPVLDQGERMREAIILAVYSPAFS